MTTFAELEKGTRFHFNIDADGHEPYMYKVNDQEAYVEHGSDQGLREAVAADKEVWEWSEPVTLHDSPTEVERAALTLLMGGQHGPFVAHVGLAMHIRALATDPGEMRRLDTYIWESDVEIGFDEDKVGNRISHQTPLRELCVERGHPCWTKEWDRENSALDAITDEKPTGSKPQTREEDFAAAKTAATFWLASAVCDYRVAGRADGDQAHTIKGLGADLLTVTTSLAAAIAEYHDRIVNIYAGDKFDMMNQLQQITPTDLITQAEAAQRANVTIQAINNAIRERRVTAYSGPDAISHRPGDRKVSAAEVAKVWPPRND